MDEPDVIAPRPADQSVVETRYWHTLDDGRVQCDVCPRACKLRDGQRGLCFVRGAEAGRIKLFSYGRSSGFCIDPIEKKPLNHFLPGTSVLSFGTAGCNLACKYCFVPDTPIATTDGMRPIADLFESCDEKIGTLCCLIAHIGTHRLLYDHKASGPRPQGEELPSLRSRALRNHGTRRLRGAIRSSWRRSLGIQHSKSRSR